ncbi:glutaredoxin family protein [Mailhella sp.]|uniref:glutaredoxin family protein n=1 Tax=Mailhella sp. TaxID=1981029 RepID=UPI0040636063
MNTVIYIAAAVIAVAIVAVIVLKKGKDAPKPAPAEDSGDPELYALGMNPISDKPVMYALTTCQHCKNTLRFLNEKNVVPTVIYLDEFNGSRRSDLMEKVRTYNPRGTFPVVLVPGGKVVVGYRKQLLQEALFDDAGRTA